MDIKVTIPENPRHISCIPLQDIGFSRVYQSSVNPDLYVVAIPESDHKGEIGYMVLHPNCISISTCHYSNIISDYPDLAYVVEQEHLYLNISLTQAGE